MDECWRVLRDDGSCWVNLGDKFAGSGGHNNAGISTNGTGASTLSGGRRKLTELSAIKATRRTAPDRYNQNTGSLRPKSRMLLPHRFAHGLIDPDYRAFEEHRAGLTSAGAPQWICRMDVVQSKLNGLPESCTDRVRASHETWFHLTKSERYFASIDEIREETTDASVKHVDRYSGRYASDADRDGRGDSNGRGIFPLNALGKLPGSVWEWANEPLVLPPDLPQHFAAFASWTVSRIVLCW
jgi:hypothetical protein